MLTATHDQSKHTLNQTACLARMPSIRGSIDISAWLSHLMPGISRLGKRLARGKSFIQHR